MVARIPVSEIVHVAAGVNGSPFPRHGHVPQLRQSGRAGRAGTQVLSFRSARAVLHNLLVLGTFVLKPYLDLCLSQAQFGRQVGALGQRQVLGLLEALVQHLQLEAGVDGSGLPDLLPFSVYTNLPVFYDGRLLVIGVFKSRVPQSTAVVVMLVGQVGAVVVSRHRARVRVPHRASIRARIRREGALVLRVSTCVQTVNGIVAAGQRGGVLLMGREPVTELQEG